MQIKKKLILVKTSSKRRELYDNLPKAMINCTQFHICTPSSFSGIKANARTRAKKTALGFIVQINAAMAWQNVIFINSFNTPAAIHQLKLKDN